MFHSKTLSFFVAGFILAAPFTGVFAEEEAAGVSYSTELELQATTEPAAKILLTQNFIFPFLRGNSPLTEGNNLKASITADITPISLVGIAEAVLTPIAFLEFSGGASAGSGWNIELFGGDVNGIGVNIPVGLPPPEDGDRVPRKSEVRGDAFGGLHWHAWGGAAFQFDLAAVYPGDWHHILFRTYHEANYGAYSGANSGEPWFFQDDYGENQNGWVYNSSYLIGYYMPLSPVLTLTGFMAEMRKNLYDTPGGELWGDNLGYWIFSGLFNFDITPAFSTLMAIQFKTKRDYRDTDLLNSDLYYYQDLRFREDAPSRKVVFYRLALILNYKLR